MPSTADRQKAFSKGPGQSEPFDIWPGDVDHMPPFPFPTLGGLLISPKINGWVIIKSHVVHNTDAEQRLFAVSLKVGHGYGIIEATEEITIFGEYQRA